MAEQPKKPRNIQDLKARLGKTVVPANKGGPASVAPPGAAGSAVPPPGLGGIPVPSQSPTRISSQGMAAAIPAPNLPGSVAPPPIMERHAPPRPAARDPFAAAAQAPAGPREVRIVVDERAVEESETAGRRRKRSFLLLVLGMLAGAIAGGIIASVLATRGEFKLSVQHGKEIYQSVRNASETVVTAQQLVNEAITQARGGPGRTPAVAYATIERLRALEKPIAANAFSRKYYAKFKPETVDTLFEYYNSVQLVWARLERIAARTLPEARRRVLDASALSAQEIVTAQTGCVPVALEGRVFCGLVYVNQPDQPTEEAPSTVKVSVRRGGPATEKTVYTGQDLTEQPEQYVILTHTPDSVGVLGQQASDFAEYQRDLIDLKQLLDRTVELQGRLEQQVGAIAQLE